MGTAFDRLTREATTQRRIPSKIKDILMLRLRLFQTSGFVNRHRISNVGCPSEDLGQTVRHSKGSYRKLPLSSDRGCA